MSNRMTITGEGKRVITLEDAESIARQMSLSNLAADVQTSQTLFRMQLVEGWQIPHGAKVLEIGCGQGDMTAVLASAVGPTGHVTAVDIAAPDYGAPVTLGESAKILRSMPLGRQIDFHFQYDVLDVSHDFSEDTFDYVVLAHCSWYFESLDQFRRLLLRVRPWAKRLCYSEWDMQPYAMDQVAHMLAVLIQGQIEAHNVDGIRNVRTPFSKTTLLKLLQETGWTLSSETAVDASLLQDAGWEINDCLHSCRREAATLNLPMKLQELIGSQIDTLQMVAGSGENRPLPSYSVMADKSSETSQSH